MSSYHTNINSANHHCPKCSHKMWVLKYREDGLIYGHNFVVCKNASHPPFFHAWPLGVEHAPSTTRTVHVPAPASPDFTPLPLRKPKKNKCSKCRKRIHRHCGSRLCREHCLAKKDSDCHVHKEALPSLQAPLQSAGNLSILHDKQKRAQEDAVAALALRLPLPPSPTGSQEAADRELPYRLKYGLSLSPLLPPCQCAPRSPRLVASSSRISLPSLPSSSSSSSATSSPFLKTPPSLFSLLAAYKTKCTLTIYFWVTDNSHATVSIVRDRPQWETTWPQITLNDIHHIIASTASPAMDKSYICYFPKLQEWIEVSVVDSLPIDTDTNALFIRQVGVVGCDENKHMAVFSARGCEKAPIIDAAEPAVAKRRLHNIIDISSDEDEGEDDCDAHRPAKHLYAPLCSSSLTFPTSIALPLRARSVSS
ncbi:hypothetical protein K438DRAFT_1999752 [Mycena galopus ATCC 62051]|nr:hypothetical protein K438DRAFT_1999752 [Mycena galopus ATCC 62051]